jgi:hypothetical protein
VREKVLIICFLLIVLELRQYSKRSAFSSRLKAHFDENCEERNSRNSDRDKLTAKADAYSLSNLTDIGENNQDHQLPFIFTISPHQLHRHMHLDIHREEQRNRLALAEALRNQVVSQTETTLADMTLEEKQHMLRRIFTNKVQAERRTLNLVRSMLLYDDENAQLGSSKAVQRNNELSAIARQSLQRLSSTSKAYDEFNRHLVLQHAAEQEVNQLQNKASGFLQADSQRRDSELAISHGYDEVSRDAEHGEIDLNEETESDGEDAQETVAEHSHPTLWSRILMWPFGNDHLSTDDNPDEVEVSEYDSHSDIPGSSSDYDKAEKIQQHKNDGWPYDQDDDTEAAEAGDQPSIFSRIFVWPW